MARRTSTRRVPIFRPGQIEQTLAASTEPYRTLFTVAALTGARISEMCGLTWADVALDDLDESEITLGFQVDRHGNRRATKTDAAGNPIPAPPGSVPSMHSFRHTVASRALLAGESVDEVAFFLGHRDAPVESSSAVIGGRVRSAAC